MSKNPFMRPYVSRKKDSCIVIPLIFLFLTFNVLIPCSSFAAESPVKKILIIDSYNQDMPISKLFLKGVQESFRHHPNLKIDYYYEYLDQIRLHKTDENMDYLRVYLKEKYSSQRLDLVIAHRQQTYDLMVKNGEPVFSGVPMICADDEREGSPNVGESLNLVQVVGRIDITESFKVLMQTRPKTKRIYVLIGLSKLERNIKSNLTKQLTQFSSRVEIVYLDNLTVPELLQKVDSITGDAALMYFLISQDVTGKTYLPQDVLQRIRSHAKVPIYTTAGTYLGRGIVGGYLFNGQLLGNRVAKIGLEILQGRFQQGTRTEYVTAGENLFDWRELRRWGIDESALPPGSKVLYKKPGLWDLYRWYIIIALMVVTLETVLILALLTSRVKLKRAEAAMTKLNTDLEIRVAERTRELETAIQEQRTAKEKQEEMNLSLRKLNEQLDWNSRTDMLTGLFNRRHIIEQIQAELENLRRSGRTFGLIIGDIDHFKQINDTYGHNVGDFLLRKVAEELRNVARLDDTVARWGGEEFLCLLPGVNIDTALKVAERMRSVIDSQSFDWDGVAISITMTFGVSIVDKADTADTIIQRADQALYKGKVSGRNKVVGA